MIDFALPAFLWAGAFAALLPVALHLIARRPPDRVPLPTARFLRQDQRTRLRIRRRPSDLLLMAIRAGFLLALGLGLAAPTWTGSAAGTAEIVLLDRSGASHHGWTGAVAEARTRLLAPDGSSRGVLVLFDTTAVVVPSTEVARVLDTLEIAGPIPTAPRYGPAFSALGAARSRLLAESASVTVIGTPVAQGWTPGLASLRAAAWAGSVEWVAPVDPVPAAPVPATAEEDAPRARRARVSGGAEGRFVPAALEALGWAVDRAADGALPELRVVLPGTGAPDPVELDAAARAGAIVLIAGDTRSAAGLELWVPEPVMGGSRREAGIVAFPDGYQVAGVGGRMDGAPAPGARVVAVWEDGSPAGVARPLGEGCATFLAADPEAGRLPTSARLPGLLRRLLEACAPPHSSSAGFVPLDEGALHLLRSPESPPRLALGASGGAPRLALAPWLLALAAILLVAETAAAYLRRSDA
jgi:hypothetical protein